MLPEDGKKAPGLKFGQPRVLALLLALTMFHHLIEGFRNRDLSQQVADLPGVTLAGYTPHQMTYDLRRLRLKGLIYRPPKISTPFEIHSEQPPDPKLARIQGKQIHFRKALEGEERVMTQMAGFGASVTDYDLRVVNTKTGAGVRITADRLLARLMLWSIRAVVAVEPFIDFTIQPGESYAWTLTYRYLKQGE